MYIEKIVSSSLYNFSRGNPEEFGFAFRFYSTAMGASASFRGPLLMELAIDCVWAKPKQLRCENAVFASNALFASEMHFSKILQFQQIGGGCSYAILPDLLQCQYC